MYHPMEFQFPNTEAKEDEYFLPVTSRSVKGIKPQYYISNYGHFYSTYSDRLMKPTVAASKRRTGGYYVNTVGRNKKAIEEIKQKSVPL